MSSWEPTVGGSDEWYTPAYIFEALDCWFDCDVAAPCGGPLHVPCSYSICRDSLETDWDSFGLIWMNPPFGGRNGIVPWLDKFFHHHNGIALTPDRTSAPWFRDCWPYADAVMFLPKVKFIRPDGSLGKQPGTGTALWAAGASARQALRRAENAGLGIMAFPSSAVRAWKAAA